MTWRRFDPVGPRFQPWMLLLVGLGLTLASIGSDWLTSIPEPEFQLYGVNAALAYSAALMALAALLSSGSDRGDEVVVVMILSVLAMGALGVVAFLLLSVADKPDAALTFWAYCAAFLLILIWLTFAVRRVFQSFEGVLATRPSLRAVAFALGAVALAYVLPTWPSFTDDRFDRRTANVWEIASAWRDAKQAGSQASTQVDRWASVELSQPALLDAELARLAPRDPGKGNLFVLGVAGWGEQAVFRREASEGTNVLAERFGTGSRTALLLNSRDTADTRPAASLTNLAWTLRTIGSRMDREADALVLVITTHGSPSGLALSHGSMVRRLLSPADLKTVLDGSGIKNRILIVSACYAGGFATTLADEKTAVFTASASDRTSFGCSDEREWTYFGDAFFNRALRERSTLGEAFRAARETVAEWEAKDGVTPSLPQARIGEALARRFPDVVGHLGEEKRAALDPVLTSPSLDNPHPRP